MRLGRLAAVGRALLGLAGLAVVVYLVRDAGTERVGRVLWQAGAWLPLVVALEIYQAVSDFLALRSTLGDEWRKVSTMAWVRSSVIAYAFMILVPAGRAAGEVSRATILSAALGPGRAATASTQLQAGYLGANGVVSLVEFFAVAAFFGPGSPLALLLLGNFVVQGIISGGLLAMLWDARVGRFLDGLRRRLIPGATESPPVEAAVRRKLPIGALLVSTAARSAQVLQYGIVLVAVGGTFSAQGAIVSHGIHLVGATLGDLVPNQLGVMDGMYRTFAGTLGFGDEPARALSIMFVIRMAQVIVAASCLLTAAVTRSSAAPPAPRAAPSPGAGARS